MHSIYAATLEYTATGIYAHRRKSGRCPTLHEPAWLQSKPCKARRSGPISGRILLRLFSGGVIPCMQSSPNGPCAKRETVARQETISLGWQAQRSQCDHFNQLAIGGKKIQIAQRFPRAPENLFEDVVSGIAWINRCGKKHELDRFGHFSVLMASAVKLRADTRGCT